MFVNLQFIKATEKVTTQNTATTIVTAAATEVMTKTKSYGRRKERFVLLFRRHLLNIKNVTLRLQIFMNRIWENKDEKEKKSNKNIPVVMFFRACVSVCVCINVHRIKEK